MNNPQAKAVKTLTDELVLVDGTFTPDEATDVLLTMIRKKIDYHNGLIFDTWERCSEACPDSEARLKALRQLREQILSIGAEARSSGQKMQIRCEIEIDLVDDKAPAC